MLRSGHFFDPPSGTCLWSLCCSKCFCWSNIERNWHKKKWTRFSLKNHGRWQPGSPRYLRTNRGTYRQFNRIKNWRKFMVKKIVIFDHVCGRGPYMKLILFFLFDNMYFFIGLQYYPKFRRVEIHSFQRQKIYWF